MMTGVNFRSTQHGARKRIPSCRFNFAGQILDFEFHLLAARASYRDYVFFAVNFRSLCIFPLCLYHPRSPLPPRRAARAYISHFTELRDYEFFSTSPLIPPPPYDLSSPEGNFTSYSENIAAIFLPGFTRDIENSPAREMTIRISLLRGWILRPRLLCK